MLELRTEPVACCICGTADAEPLAVGEDFEYHTSDDTFLAVRCKRCHLIYLNARPAAEEFARIYPSNYHAFAFTAERFGLVYRVRRRLEAARLLSWFRSLGPDARILDVGCGDGFHLQLLRDFGKPGWQLAGVDADERAVALARRRGLHVRRGSVSDAVDEAGTYDAVLLIQTIEHVADPPEVLRAIHRMLRPGGRLVVVTDNTASIDARIFRGRHWGGYHFPRHWNLFDRRSLRNLAGRVGFDVARLTTIVSPVNWVYSIRNVLVDFHAPRWVTDAFSLESAPSLAVFTLLDTVLSLSGRGALLCAILERPA